MSNKDYILDLLARGAGNGDVARLAGVSPAYVTQLQDDPQFVQELNEKRALHAAERNDRANKTSAIHKKYLDLEDMLLDRLTVQAKSGLLKPIEQMKLLQVVATKKEPLSPHEAQQQNTVNVVTQISLPTQIAAQFVLNQNSEIVGTEDGKSFAPMSTQGLRDLAAQKALPAPKPQMHKTEDILRMFALKPNAEDEIKI